MRNLFRKEVLDCKKERFWGEVLLTQPFSYKVLSIGVFLALVTLIIILLNGEYARREKVRGYITTDKGVIKIFPSVAGSLIEINVIEGQYVNKGDTLANVHTAKKNAYGENLPEIIIQELHKQKVLINQKISQDSQISRLETDKLSENIEGYQLEREIANNRLENLKSRKQINKLQLDKLLSLKNSGFVSDEQLLDAKKRHLQLIADIQAIEQGIVSMNKTLKNTRSELKQLPIRAEKMMSEYKRQLAVLEQQIIETKGRESYSIKSSISGHVTSIQSKVGQSVGSHQPLLAILPDDAVFLAELFIPSRAIGFIEVDKEVLIRYDAFPYQRFGLYKGTISNVAESIFLPGELPIPVTLNEPVYRAKIKLDSQYVSAFSKQLTIQSGMLLDADIILEKRSFIEWILEPLYSLKGNI
jgi:membrane fusion protein